MKLVSRKNIDDAFWNDKVDQAMPENIFMHTWYLDAVTENWCAVISNDGSTIVPIPFTKKLNVKQFIQAPFTRQYEIVGNEFSWIDVLNFIQDKFKGVHFRTSQDIENLKCTKRNHQFIDLKQPFKYSENAKRMLKKAGKYELKKSAEFDEVIDLFSKHVAHRIDTISKKDIVKLRKLMQVSTQLKRGEVLSLYENEQCIAAGFFLLGNKCVTYLKGASTDDAKKNGAMYRIIDEAIKKYNSFEIFDFGGSDIDNVAEFYHKFGAQDQQYYDYQIDNLPSWFKLLKKLKS